MRQFTIIKLAANIIKNNKFVDNIRIYKFKNEGRTVGDINNMEEPSLSTNLSGNKKEFIKEVLRENRKINYKHSSDKNKLIKYIPYQVFNNDGNINWAISYVIGIDF